MTKLRPPASFENTLYGLLGSLTIERAAEVTGRAVSYLRALSDPDKREQLTLADALALDLEHRSSGRDGFPFYQTYGLLLEQAGAERFADAAALSRHAAILSRESGEANAALIEAALSNGSPAALETALRELEQDHHAGVAAMTMIRDALRRARDGP